MSAEHGAWSCKKCGAAGSWWGFLNDHGDIKLQYKKKEIKLIPEPENKNDATSKKWIAWRGISEETATAFGLLSDVGKVGFVYRTPQGEPYLVKWRMINDKKFFSEPAGTEIHFPYNAKKHQGKQLIICEGEIDALTWYEYGFQNVVAIPGANSYKQEWLKYFDSYQEIYLSLDMDDAGQGAVEKIANMIGKYKCKIVTLPYKDINECLKNKMTREEIKAIVERSTAPKNEKLKSIADFRIKKATAEEYGVTTGYKSLDDLTKWRPRELTVITADTKQGKTMFAVNLIIKQALKSEKCIIGSFEMGADSTVRQILSVIANKSYYQMEDSEIAQWKPLLNHLPIWMVDTYGEIDMQALKDAIYFGAKYYGVKFVLIDHLHFFCKLSGDKMHFELGKIMKELKQWCMELDLCMILIVHPGKVPRGERITANDLRGSSDIKQIADNVIRIEADKEKETSTVSVLISRHMLAKTGDIELKYNVATSQFAEVYKSCHAPIIKRKDYTNTEKD